MGAAGTDATDLFTALSHPIRRQILRELMRRRAELSPSEIAGRLGQSLGRLSYHFSILIECRAIELVRTQPVRGSTQHFYRATIDADWARKALRATASNSKPRRRGKKSADRRLMHSGDGGE